MESSASLAGRSSAVAGLSVRSAGREHAALLRERVLRDDLFPLQLLDAVLQLDDLRFVDFERGLHGGSRKSARARVRRASFRPSAT